MTKVESMKMDMLEVVKFAIVLLTDVVEDEVIQKLPSPKYIKEKFETDYIGLSRKNQGRVRYYLRKWGKDVNGWITDRNERMGLELDYP